MSTVILSNMPYGCQEADIHRHLLMYGIAVKININNQLGQATVTMRTPQEAQALINRRTINILGSTVRVDPETTSTAAHNTSNQAYHATTPQAIAANTNTTSNSNTNYNQYNSGNVNTPVAMPSPQQQQQQQQRNQPSARLSVVVEQCRYEITRDVLLQMFTMVGQPVHVYCGPWATTTTGEVEFADVQTAIQAMERFNDKAIYPGCCFVHLSYISPGQALPIQHHTPQAPQQSQAPQQLPASSPATPMNYYPNNGNEIQNPYMNANPNAMPGAQGMPYKPQDNNVNYEMRTMSQEAMPIYQQQQQQQQLQQQFQQQYDNNYDSNNENNYNNNNNDFGRQGGRSSNEMYNSARTEYDGGYNTFNSGQMRRGRGAGNGGNMGYNNSNNYNSSNNNAYGRGMNANYTRGGRAGGFGSFMGNRAGGATRGGRGAGMFHQSYNDGFSPFAASRGAHRGGRAGAMMHGPTPHNTMPFTPYAPFSQEATVIVSNVAESVSMYDLWVLLEVYGNVNSLRRQFRDKYSIVAQFQNVMDAKSAVFFLQNCTFRGRPLTLKYFAGYVERGARVEWDIGPATDPATPAILFTTGYHHRTKPSAPFNPLGRIRPSNNLYISNLIESITDEDLKKVFKDAGFTFDKYYRKNATTAVGSFKTVEMAIDALIAVHAHQMRDRFFRITFSRFAPGPRPDEDKEEQNQAEDVNDEMINAAVTSADEGNEQAYEHHDTASSHDPEHYNGSGDKRQEHAIEGNATTTTNDGNNDDDKTSEVNTVASNIANKMSNKFNDGPDEGEVGATS